MRDSVFKNNDPNGIPSGLNAGTDEYPSRNESNLIGGNVDSNEVSTT
jgi:hypothetical protein